jgi:hypothetical protein
MIMLVYGFINYELIEKYTYDILSSVQGKSKEGQSNVGVSETKSEVKIFFRY